MREDDRTGVSETRPDRQYRMPPCPIHSQFRVVGHDLGGRTHRTCPLSDFEPPSTWLKGATVESRRGAVAEAMRHRSVFSPRSSNRTCGFTASGSPTGFTSRHTVDCQFGLVSRDDTVARNQLSPCGRAPSEASGYFQVLQAHRQSPILGSFESVPEVRVLSSAGITRPHRSYDPVRLPPGPPCSPRRWRCDLRPERASPDYPDHLSNVPCPIPRWIGTGAYVGCFPIPRGLPRFPGGSASTISLSRPAQTSLALRPAGSLNRPRRPLSRGFETAGYPTAPLVSYQINRQLSGWYLPPLVIRAFGAHWEIPDNTPKAILSTRRSLFTAGSRSHKIGYSVARTLTP